MAVITTHFYLAPSMLLDGATEVLGNTCGVKSEGDMPLWQMTLAGIDGGKVTAVSTGTETREREEER